MARKRPPSAPLTIVSSDASASHSSPLATPPRSLRTAGRELWRTVMSEYHIVDAGGLAILAQACGAADRVAECAEGIDAEGVTVHTRTGVRAHPLLRAEAEQRALVCRLL